MSNEEFYRECAKLLNTEYNCNPFPWHKRTRWNNRSPGSGRYPGHGLIRCYGIVVHVNIHTPVKLNQVFDNKDEALEAIKNLMDH